MRNDGDELIVKYKMEKWLVVRFFGDKCSSHWPEVPRVLQFVRTKLVLVWKGSLNTTLALYHCVLQH